MRFLIATLWAFNLGMLGWHVTLPRGEGIPEYTPEMEFQHAQSAKLEKWGCGSRLECPAFAIREARDGLNGVGRGNVAKQGRN